MDVSVDFFKTVGVSPLYGRGFLPDEENHSSSVIVLSYALWGARFGRNPNIVGRTIIVDGQPALVIGVMPHVFDNNLDAQLPPV